MLQRLLRQTRGLRRLAVAGVAVVAVLLAASLPKAAWAHELRAEEVVSEASEQFGPTWTPYDGTSGDVLDHIAALSATAALPRAVATSAARSSASVRGAPRSPFRSAVASRAPPARR